MQNTAHIVFFINLDAIIRGIAGNKMIVFIIIIKLFSLFQVHHHDLL